ncbi:hypothetical protein ACOMHN_067734 [Nucella lapillus]
MVLSGTMMSDELESEDKALLKETDPDSITVEASYKGPHLTFPITRAQVQTLVQAFKSKQLLHVKYLLQLLHETRLQLRQRGNINRATTSIGHQITICGDLHGKIDDLYMIFHKNGLPSVDNPYVFNGDFVDRGGHSIEVAALLFACFVVSPNEVYLNRGNHEDHLMNIRYGFIREIMKKYKDNATKVVRLFEDVFSWLPIATVINERVLVVHGGVSEQVDLAFLETIDRHKFVSVLRPPGAMKLTDVDVQDLSDSDIQEWKQMLDLLWSDPKPIRGSIPNTFRGGGCYFGPDVTRKVLESHNLELLIRSHECKPDGFEYTHDNQVLTIFSASNYYEEGSNRGAYVKLLDNDPEPHIIQYVSASSTRRKVTFTQRISKLESSALNCLREKMLASKLRLMEEFHKLDTEKTGFITPMEWSAALESTLDMDVPWVLLRPRLVTTNNQGLVDYASTFSDLTLNSKTQDSALSVTEMLYRHKDILETIFRIFDKDNSGFISMPEFTEACGILIKHANVSIPPSHISDIAHSLDINKDGFIDFNEFLEAFRIVDMGGDCMGMGGRWSPEEEGEDAGLGGIVEEAEEEGGVRVGEEVLEIEDLELNDSGGGGGGGKGRSKEGWGGSSSSSTNQNHNPVEITAA